MRGRIKGKASVAIAAALIALGVSLLASSSASAQEELLSLDSKTIHPGTETTIELQAQNIDGLGLGAWTIGVIFDADVLTAINCSSPIGSLCNVDFESGRVQVVGANAAGLTGDLILARITFVCNQAGVSDLAFVVEEFADSTVGAPRGIGFRLQAGRVACSPESVAPPPRLLGDANCDGLVNSRDALLVLQLEAGLINSLPCPDLADVNQDGRIDSRDAALIKQIDAGLL